MVDGDKIALERAVTDKLDKLTDGSILYTRTLHFPGAGEEPALLVERMTNTELCAVRLEWIRIVVNRKTGTATVAMKFKGYNKNLKNRIQSCGSSSSSERF